MIYAHFIVKFAHCVIKFHLRSAGLNHFFQHLTSHPTDGFILCHGVVGELVVVTDMTRQGIAMLICQKLTVLNYYRVT